MSLCRAARLPVGEHLRRTSGCAGSTMHTHPECSKRPVNLGSSGERSTGLRIRAFPLLTFQTLLHTDDADWRGVKFTRR